MRRVAYWATTVLVALAAVVGLILLINSRDLSNLSKDASNAAAPGVVYHGAPPLSSRQRAALRRGNVIVFYRAAKPPAGVHALAPAGSAALERVGQAVLLARDPRLGVPLTAVSRTRVLSANTPGQLQSFVDYWLGG